MKLESWTE